VDLDALLLRLALARMCVMTVLVYLKLTARRCDAAGAPLRWQDWAGMQTCCALCGNSCRRSGAMHWAVALSSALRGAWASHCPGGINGAAAQPASVTGLLLDLQIPSDLPMFDGPASCRRLASAAEQPCQLMSCSY